MNDPWPRLKSFVFCTMIFVIFGTLMSWAQSLNGNVTGIDEPIGKLVFLLAVVSIALILLVQKLDLKWIARISSIICLCVLYYILTVSIRYGITTSTVKEGFAFLKEGVYLTFISSGLSALIALMGSSKSPIK